MKYLDNVKIAADNNDIKSEKICFRIQIENLQHVGLAYGPGEVDDACSAVGSMLAHLFGSDARITVDSDQQFLIAIDDRLLLGEGPPQRLCEKWLMDFCIAAALRPVVTGRDRIHIALSGAWAIESAAGETVSGQVAPFTCDPPCGNSRWAESYRQDMRLVADLLSLLDETRSTRYGQLVISWQPVFNIHDAPKVMYHEALIGRLVDDGSVATLTEEILAIERLGMVRALDQHMFAKVIRELELFPDIVLGVNLSARSVSQDAGWVAVQDRLRRNRGVAERLILEITETSALPAVADAAHFVRAMQHLGCRIALDDFGTGFASIRQLLALGPSIAKIDRFFVNRLDQSQKDHALLACLMDLARSLDVGVVVEGVETESQARAAAALGADLQQGWFWQRPTTLRPWSVSQPGG